MKLKELLSQLQSVQEKTGASPCYICGGTPRDRYLKHLENIADIDLTTGDKTVEYLSQEFSAELKKKYNVERKTMSDGHSTIFIGNLKIDFSSNYNVPNINTYLNKIGINKPTEMQKEMFSRDFTCNSLLLSLDLKNVIDPTHKGFKDIDAKLIKTCLDPEITLTTNRNRVIRAIYLACKLDFNIDESIVKYVKQHPESVKISTNKVMSEKLNEAFAKNPDKASFYLTKMNLWNYIPITEIVYPYYIKNVKGGILAKK
jgi:tRNA nucleotidyltransferase (CCA-adding enzyme)